MPPPININTTSKPPRRRSIQSPIGQFPPKSEAPRPSMSRYGVNTILGRRSESDTIRAEPTAGPSSSRTATPRTSISTDSGRFNWVETSSDDAETGALNEKDATTAEEVHWWGRGARTYSPGPTIPLIRRGSVSRSKEKDPDRGWIVDKVLDIIGMGSGYDEHRPGRLRNLRRRDRELEKLTKGSHVKRKSGRIALTEQLLEILPRTPTSMVAFILCLTMLAAFITMSLKYILNPDKAALPWRRYCTAEYPTLFSLQDLSRPNQITGESGTSLTLYPLTPSHPSWPYPGHSRRPYDASLQADIDLEPVGVFVGVFSMDSGRKRRDMIRQSYGSHPSSRRSGTESVSLRFIMGTPRSEYKYNIEQEMKDHGDIVILDIVENMNSGKTYSYFTWAAENAMVPHYTWDDVYGQGVKPTLIGERRPDYIVKADDDAFIMLNELERRLRATPRQKTFWGYLVKNRFMAGECYGLSLDLVKYIASTPAIKRMTWGKEDVLVSRWMKSHPERESIVWASESCWIYDHPKAGTVYSHGFLFPSEVQTVREEIKHGLAPHVAAIRGGPNKEAYSSVTKFGTAYRSLSSKMDQEERVEALVEGSLISQLRDEVLYRPAEYDENETLKHRISRLYRFRPTRQERFLGDPKERGGTVVVHYLKRAEWFVETAIALLGLTAEQADRLAKINKEKRTWPEGLFPIETNSVTLTREKR